MARVAVVTGGTRGIGEAISKALKAAGYKVAANYAGNDEAAQKFKAATDIPVYKWDVSNFEACGAGLKQIESDLGPVDVLVNNAGITRDRSLLNMSDAEWSSVIDVNLTGAFNMMRAVVPGMAACGFGRVVNITSINGLRGKFGQANYAAAKAGLIGLTKTAAREFGRRGVTVNAVAPGMVMTDMARTLPQEVLDRAGSEAVLTRLAEPRDISDAVLFLLSDAARSITGEVLRVDAGQYI